MKRLLLIIGISVLLFGCADSKQFNINGRTVTIEPYGWADYQELKNDSIVYKANTGNIVLSIICSESIFIPVWLTGWQLYEPIYKK